MTADDICKALLAGKTPEATRKQESNLQAAIFCVAGAQGRRGRCRRLSATLAVDRAAN